MELKSQVQAVQEFSRCELPRILTDRAVTDRVLTDGKLLVRILWLWHLMLGHLGLVQKVTWSVDIVESTRRRRLLIVVGTRSTNIHDATMWLLQWLSVQLQWLRDSWSVGTPLPIPSLFLGITQSLAREAEKMCLERVLT